MSLATFGQTAVSALPELVDVIAAHTGSWVVVERFGSVMCHGIGQAQCPAALEQSLIGKSTAPLRAAVTWTRGQGLVRGMLERTALVATDLGGGTTVWFLGGETATVPDLIAVLAAAVHDESAPVVDPVVAELLHPRGPARRGAAPPALLLALSSDLPARALSRLALAAVAGSSCRVHLTDDMVLIALTPETEVAPVLTKIAAPGLRGGVSLVDKHASDWVTAAHLAAGSLRAAGALGLTLGDPTNPPVAAELVLQEAQAAVGDLVRLLPAAPLQRLQEHDRRVSGELVASLTAWCRAGFDVPTAASSLHVHANTLRYRLKRAGEVSGMDLRRPRHLLALQLLLAV